MVFTSLEARPISTATLGLMPLLLTGLLYRRRPAHFACVTYNVGMYICLAASLLQAALENSGQRLLYLHTGADARVTASSRGGVRTGTCALGISDANEMFTGLSSLFFESPCHRTTPSILRLHTSSTKHKKISSVKINAVSFQISGRISTVCHVDVA